MRREIVRAFFIYICPLSSSPSSFLFLPSDSNSLASGEKTQKKTISQEARRRAPADEPKITIDDIKNGSYGKKIVEYREREKAEKEKKESSASFSNSCRLPLSFYF